MAEVEPLNQRAIPSIDQLLRSASGIELQERFGSARATAALRQQSAQLRAQMVESEIPIAQRLLESARLTLESEERPSLRPVINATGVILHTNLGRSPLAAAALRNILENAAGYTNLEIDLVSGERGSRYSHVTGLLRQLTGAPAALVVNNCAAAMMLIVEVLARAKEVIVSRGELVEIGGSYRVPDILQRGGARLIEVGTTNRTRIEDFRRAVSADTGMLLSTHLSNFSMAGFVEAPGPQQLAALGRELGIVSCLDLGSGLLRPHPQLAEPSVIESLAAGFDLVAFSGDKLLGATQAGIILGRQDLIERLAADPLQRALRVDKLTLAGLEATLRIYLDPAAAQREIPVLARLQAGSAELKDRAQRLARSLKKSLGSQAEIAVRAGESSVGGGSLPGQTLPSWLVTLTLDHEEDWAARLRHGQPAVLVRRSQGQLWLDVRTISDQDVARIKAAFEAAAGKAEKA